MLRHAPLLARGLVLVFALALAATGLGHRFASAAELQRAQFTQIFGAELCLTDEDGSAMAASGCPVCHLVGAAHLPEAVLGASAPALIRVALDFAIEAHLVRSATQVEQPSQRAPPIA